jgi:hypothetical protein
MKVDKAEIVAILRARGQDARADWVDRTLPDVVDTDENHSLLRSTLDIEPATMHPVGRTPQYN